MTKIVNLKPFLADNINKFGSKATTGVIGHFTVMMGDRLTKIGCAVSRFSGYKDKVLLKGTYVVCNYSFANMIGLSIYKAGPAGVDCVKGRSIEYPGLCNP
jgi:Cysteine-rich secretory protein family